MYSSAPPRRIFADAMYAVMRVGPENKGTAFPETERFSYKLERSGGVCGKDHGITRWRLEE